MSGKFRPARKASRSGRCLDRGLGEIVVTVKIPSTRGRTKRPRGALLQLAIGSGCWMRRIGGSLGGGPCGGRGGNGEIPLFQFFAPHPHAGGRWLAGSLTGAVASKTVSEARNGSLRWDGNPLARAKAQGSLTARETARAGRKRGLSDPTVPSGRAVA